ncbi:MAG TPA: transglutaminase domain-containing protein [Armatimonadota bacterium]|nr:transglutaminase domain-containing protein [Armatimonadota bacterium]
MKHTVRLLLILIAVAVIFAYPACAEESAPTASDFWMGVYMMGQKMGYMHITTEPVTYEGQKCTKVDSFFRMKTVILGQSMQQDVRTVVYAGERFAPLFQVFDMTSGGGRTTVEAKFAEKEVKCKVTSAGSTTEKVIPIPEGVSLIGDSMYALGADKIEVGQKAKLHYFNPMTISIDPMDLEVLRQEQLEVNGKTYDTFVIKNTMKTVGNVTTWQTAEGSIIKTTTAMGLTMILETAEQAVSGVDSDYVPPEDFALLTSVRANIDIKNPRQVKKLIIRLSGNLDEKMGISDNHQKVTWLTTEGEDRKAEFVIECTQFDEKQSVNLPIKDEKFASYLEPSPYLQSDAPAIKAKAAEIVGDEKSAYKAAKTIRAWVTKNMKPQADMGIPRPAVDVLNNRVGVCRDYSVLFASLARAVGIPTKVVAGIVYMNGHFYYHAWAECYVGEWVAFDATYPSDFVDATHVKLAEGDATNMFEMAPVFGTLKAEIVKYE